MAKLPGRPSGSIPQISDREARGNRNGISTAAYKKAVRIDRTETGESSTAEDLAAKGIMTTNHLPQACSCEGGGFRWGGNEGKR
jgi:hypothetical protein